MRPIGAGETAPTHTLALTHIDPSTHSVAHRATHPCTCPLTAAAQAWATPNSTSTIIQGTTRTQCAAGPESILTQMPTDPSAPHRMHGGDTPSAPPPRISSSGLSPSTGLWNLGAVVAPDDPPPPAGPAPHPTTHPGSHVHLTRHFIHLVSEQFWAPLLQTGTQLLC